MNKVAAEIIAGLIPHKMTRNQWRGILRFGLLNAWRLKRTIQHYNQTPDVGLAVCAIAKNEAPYFKEWIEWHHSQGVERFYIYDNNSTDGTHDVLKPYIESGLVIYTPFPGYRMQLAAYDHCLAHHRFEAQWLAFIDIDEFIVPIKDPSIPHFLNRFEAFAAVEVNWLIYGSNHLKQHTEGNVMQRFTRHSMPNHRLNRHVKSIVNPRRVYCMIGCHEAARIGPYNAADSHGNRITRNFRERQPQQDVIRINHYAVKSYEEFCDKQARGRASGKQREVKDNYFKQYDLNDL